jgi:hypothetical protein
MAECPDLEQLLHRFSYRLAMQSTQIAACNRLHEVEERLARWILTGRDRLHSDHLPSDTRFPGTDAGIAAAQRNRCCRHPAKGRSDFLYPWQCHHFES